MTGDTRLLTIADVVDRTATSDRTVRRWMADPSDPLPAMRLGRTVRFRPRDVDAWVDRQIERSMA